MGIQIFLRGRTRPGAYPDKRRGRAEAGRGGAGQRRGGACPDRRCGQVKRWSGFQPSRLLSS